MGPKMGIGLPEHPFMDMCTYTKKYRDRYTVELYLQL